MLEQLEIVFSCFSTLKFSLKDKHKLSVIIGLLEEKHSKINFFYTYKKKLITALRVLHFVVQSNLLFFYIILKSYLLFRIFLLYRYCHCKSLLRT